MNLAQVYALSAGQKLAKPEIVPEYFPLSFTKYITIQPFSKPIKNYNYWDDVIRLLKVVVPDYEIVQIGGPNEQPLQFCYHTQGKTSIRQAAYLVQNSALHFGVDSFAAHLAGTFDIPSVVLYSNNHINNVKPFFLSEDKFIGLFPSKLQNPVFALDIGYQPLDEINPDVIVNHILRLLKSEKTSPLKYQFIGDWYKQKVLELIPIQPFNSRQINFDCIAVRMDVVFNEEVLAKQAQLSKVVIYTNKPINPELLKAIKPQIIDIIFEIQNVSDFDIDWFKKLQKSGIDFKVFTRLSDDLIKPFKLDFCDLGNIFSKNNSQLPENIRLNETKYLSGKLVVAQDKFYSSIYDFKNNILANTNSLLDAKDCGDNDFLNEIDHFAFVTTA